MGALPTNTSSDQIDDEVAYIEYGKKELPPMYVDLQEEIERNLSEATSIFAKLRTLQAQRLKVSFDTDERAESKLQN